MHLIVVTALCWVVTAIWWLELDAFRRAMPLVLVTLVCFVGLPHGAADQRFGRPLLEPWLGRAWAPAFLAGYGMCALAVVAGWLFAPACTVVLFFLASAWHFGVEEPRLVLGKGPLGTVMQTARGGLVIWTTVTFQPESVTRVLVNTSPAESAAAIGAAMELLSFVSGGMLAIAAVAWCWQGVAATTAGGRKRCLLALDCVLVASLVTLFATTDPLAGFVVYFCGWHSARGLRSLRRRLDESWPQLVRSLAPMTLIAILLTAIGSWVVWSTPNLDDSLVRSTFIGLSAVATPHLILHGLAPMVTNRGGSAHESFTMAGGAA